jgi:hypothetical protein
MLVSLTPTLDKSVEKHTKQLLRTNVLLQEYFAEREFGPGLNAIYFGVKCIPLEYSKFFPVKKATLQISNSEQFVEVSFDGDYARAMNADTIAYALWIRNRIIEEAARICSLRIPQFDCDEFIAALRIALEPDPQDETTAGDVDHSVDRSKRQLADRVIRPSVGNPPPHPRSGDHPLQIDDSIIARLADLRKARKFDSDPTGTYPGAPSEEIRESVQATIDSLIDRLIAGVASNPSKSYVLGEFALSLNDSAGLDTEERERICDYMEEIMNIFEIESSDGLLNTWLYGFDPTRLG